MKRIFFGTVAVLIAAVLLFPCQVQGLSAEKAALLDADTGRLLYEKDAHSRSLIASTTKIMTALLICEQCNVLDRMRIPGEAVGIEGSSMGLKQGEILTLQELLYGLMLASGNDAAVALAIYCGGTVEGFVQMMNDKAFRLGLTGTHFENPHGLDSPNHYSTAWDMAVLSAYAMRDPIFRQTVSTKNVRCAGRTLQNHNKLLWRVDGADGVKTGYTKAAGRVLVSSATRQGRRLICVTVNDGNDWQDHSKLLEEGFCRYTPKQILQQGDCLGSLSVLGGTSEQVQLLAGESFSYPLSPEEEPEIFIPAPGFAFAPVVRGQNAGFAYVCLDGNVVGKVKMLFGQTVEHEDLQKPGFWGRLFGRTP